MGSLAGKSPANTYKSLLKVADETNGVSGTKSTIEDGEGTASALSLSNQVVHIQGSADATGTIKVMKSSGTLLFAVDTTNNLVKVGTSQVSATTQLALFTGYRVVPSSAGAHQYIPYGGNGFGANMAEISAGTGTDPSSTVDKTTSTDELVLMIFPVPFNITIDAVKVLSSTDTDTDTTLNFHLLSYDMVADGTTNDGNLSNGTVLADGQATSVDRSVIKTTDLTIQSSSVTSGKVIMCTVENETNTDDINIQVQVKYHIA